MCWGFKKMPSRVATVAVSIESRPSSPDRWQHSELAWATAAAYDVPRPPAVAHMQQTFAAAGYGPGTLISWGPRYPSSEQTELIVAFVERAHGERAARRFARLWLAVDGRYAVVRLARGGFRRRKLRLTHEAAPIASAAATTDRRY